MSTLTEQNAAWFAKEEHVCQKNCDFITCYGIFWLSLFQRKKKKELCKDAVQMYLISIS